MSAVLAFALALPIADVWQDATWHSKQKRLLKAELGPLEVASPAQLSHHLLMTPATNTREPLAWLKEKRLSEEKVRITSHSFVPLTLSCTSLFLAYQERVTSQKQICG